MALLFCVWPKVTISRETLLLFSWFSSKILGCFCGKFWSLRQHNDDRFGSITALAAKFLDASAEQYMCKVEWSVDFAIIMIDYNYRLHASLGSNASQCI